MTEGRIEAECRVKGEWGVGGEQGAGAEGGDGARCVAKESTPFSASASPLYRQSEMERVSSALTATGRKDELVDDETASNDHTQKIPADAVGVQAPLLGRRHVDDDGLETGDGEDGLLGPGVADEGHVE